MIKKLAVAVILVLLIGGFFLIFQKPKTEETFRYVNIKVYDPTFIAYELGYFKAEGINLTFVGQEFGGPQAILAVSSGNADGGLSAVPALVNAKKAGLKIKGVLDAQTAFENSPLGIWFILENSTIRNAADLKGKKIGINTLGASFHYSTLAYLEKNGLAKDDVEFVMVPHPNLEQALLSGQIDVAGMIDPYTTHIQDTGGVRKLFDQVDATGERQFSLIFLSEKVLSEKPETAKAFVRAYNKAVNYIRENPDRASEIMSKWMGIDSKFLKPHEFTKNAKVDEESIKYWLNTMVSRGDLKEGEISASDVATNEFNS